MRACPSSAISLVYGLLCNAVPTGQMSCSACQNAVMQDFQHSVPLRWLAPCGHTAHALRFLPSRLLVAVDGRQVMFKYVDICVEMKAGRKCKDALINYRNACQQVGGR